MQHFNSRPDPADPAANARPSDTRPARRRGLVIAAALVGLVALGAGFVAFAGGIMKSSDAYAEAMARAAADCRVADALGTPVEAGMLVSGSVETSGSAGRAELSIPVEGSQGAGTLHVVASRSLEVWSFELLRLEVEGREPVDLLSPGRCPGNAAGAVPGAAAGGTESPPPAKGRPIETAPATPAVQPAPGTAAPVQPAGKQPAVTPAGQGTGVQKP